jgi:hypothetical protein
MKSLRLYVVNNIACWNFILVISVVQISSFDHHDVGAQKKLKERISTMEDTSKVLLRTCSVGIFGHFSPVWVV